MGFDFRKSAQSTTTLSPLMEGRLKVSMEDIMKRYPDGVTVNRFDFISYEDAKKGQVTYPVLTIAEDDSVCFFGGYILTRICNEWTSGFDGDVEATSAALAENGGVKMKFKAGKTKGGNSVTTVEII